MKTISSRCWRHNCRACNSSELLKIDVLKSDDTRIGGFMTRSTPAAPTSVDDATSCMHGWLNALRLWRHVLATSRRRMTTGRGSTSMTPTSSMSASTRSKKSPAHWRTGSTRSSQRSIAQLERRRTTTATSMLSTGSSNELEPSTTLSPRCESAPRELSTLRLLAAEVCLAKDATSPTCESALPVCSDLSEFLASPQNCLESRILGTHEALSRPPSCSNGDGGASCATAHQPALLLSFVTTVFKTAYLRMGGGRWHGCFRDGRGAAAARARMYSA